ncbi:hypothetical protein GGTG_12755 [Gaeumannomyces tritici R3-111a-1]|uniref:Uncharacterized protein n=1 Tax=Gaeumannomyces tritici (strain R3-111a-1) TaxID=644352 RepID=J3PGX5_GAET3|nr:hypothetical protein GGTG_12755 [Gaeumannomyces tritici R3-111a-1]EJT69872.1 hypothetical protein GGTG_12755 [Gaeumannomyces tritici R3-111a-1]
MAEPLCGAPSLASGLVRGAWRYGIKLPYILTLSSVVLRAPPRSQAGSPSP